MVCCQSMRPSTLSNIFSTEITGPIEIRFYVEPLCLAGTKVYIIGPGHMTKMATMPIYGKNLLQIFSRTMSDDLETLPTVNVNFVHLGFYMGKSWKKESYKIKVQRDVFETYNKWIKWDSLSVGIVFFSPKVVCTWFQAIIYPHFQTSFSQKPLSRMKSNFMWNIYIWLMGTW